MPERGAARRYAKPVVVAEHLSALSGPTTGVVTLPRHLDWSGDGRYDLATPGRLVDMYRTVLIEATKPADLHTFLNDGALRRLWSFLWLPTELRNAWEAKFPELPDRTDTAATAA